MADTATHKPNAPTSNPFDGWTIQPWDGPWLWAAKSGNRELVGAVVASGWLAWSTNDVAPMIRGPETGDKGRKLAENALTKAGANIHWRVVAEAAGRG